MIFLNDERVTAQLVDSNFVSLYYGQSGDAQETEPHAFVATTRAFLVASDQ